MDNKSTILEMLYSNSSIENIDGVNILRTDTYENGKYDSECAPSYIIYDKNYSELTKLSIDFIKWCAQNNPFNYRLDALGTYPIKKSINIFKKFLIDEGMYIAKFHYYANEIKKYNFSNAINDFLEIWGINIIKRKTFEHYWGTYFLGDAIKPYIDTTNKKNFMDLLNESYNNIESNIFSIYYTYNREIKFYFEEHKHIPEYKQLNRLENKMKQLDSTLISNLNFFLDNTLTSKQTINTLNNCLQCFNKNTNIINEIINICENSNYTIISNKSYIKNIVLNEWVMPYYLLFCNNLKIYWMKLWITIFNKHYYI